MTVVIDTIELGDDAVVFVISCYMKNLNIIVVPKSLMDIHHGVVDRPGTTTAASDEEGEFIRIQIEDTSSFFF